jgi:hypothetical protein
MPLFLLFISSLLFAPQWFPTWHFQAAPPYLMAYLHRDSRLGFCWRVILIGFLVDLLSSSTFMGQTSLIYLVFGLFLHWQRDQFFVEKWPTIPLLTYLFTSGSTLFAAFFEFLKEDNFLLNWSWALTDLVQMPLIEGGFAFIVVTLPFQLREAWRKIQTSRRLNTNI